MIIGAAVVNAPEGWGLFCLGGGGLPSEMLTMPAVSAVLSDVVALTTIASVLVPKAGG